MKKIYTIIFTSLASLSSYAQWATVASMNEKRSEHVSLALPSNKVLVAGGWNTVNSKTSEVYNPTANLWTLSTGTMTSEHSTAAMVLLNDGHPLIIGGYNGTLNTTVCELYDTSTNTWSPTGSLATGRSYHTATVLQSGKVLVVGGYTGTTNLNSCELYDPTTKLWTPVGNLSVARSYHTATLLPSGKVVVTGGYNATSFQLNSVEIFDPSTNSWTAGANLANVRSRHGASLLKSGKVLVTGGEHFNGGSPYAYDAMTSNEIYDPASNLWSAAAAIPVGICYHNQYTMTDGRVVVIAGLDKTNYGTSFTYTNSTTYLYTPSSNTWEPLVMNLDGRLNYASALMPNGKLLVSGGFGEKSSEILNGLPPLSIAESAIQNSIHITPNPTTGLLYLSSKEQKNIQKVELIDMLGKFVDIPINGLNTSSVVLQLNAQANGIYCVKIYVDDKVETAKIVVEK